MLKLPFPGLMAICFILYSCTDTTKGPVDFVNPFLGTGGHGHTYPGASLPFGMVQLSPDTRLEGWDGCSAYHYSDSVIYGFSHTHLSGTGCSDYGDILVMPVTGQLDLNNYAFRSAFKKRTESAFPGYYRVELEKYKVIAELTATLRTGMHRYTFTSGENPGIVIDLKHRDEVIASSLRISGPAEVEGMRVSRAWAAKQFIYFVARFSLPVVTYRIQSGNTISATSKTAEGNNIKAIFYFKIPKGEPLLVKVGISAVSMEGARQNLEKENPSWDFDAVRNMAKNKWNSELGKILVEGGSNDQRTVFYTALYHSMLSPDLYMDVDRQYLGRDFKPHLANGFDYYSVFSLWDTYRAEHPLLTLIDRKRTSDFINTFLNQYRDGGMLPVWELSSNETGCMIGYHAVPVIADAWSKGIRSFDGELALEAMKHSALQEHLGLKYYKTKGYIPGDEEGESVSKTLEYSYDDWCIARMAQFLGAGEDYKTFIRRAQYYKNVFDRSTGFMRAKNNETWFSPFDPSEVNFNYTEANAWQYSFYVPQDISGLIELLGGKNAFAARLDALFTAPSKTTGRDQADISGMIGQYAHGNEPSHHMAYLYDFAGKPWKTQEIVHRICREFYKNDPDGLCGNEDCGQMSAWYVLSAMGLYQVTPASGIYTIGTPIFPRAVIRMEDGKSLTIEAVNLSTENYYIQSATMNGHAYDKCFINHEEIMKGGILRFIMGPKPDTAWGSRPGDFPVTSITDQLITPVPSVERGKRTFMDSTTVSLSCPDKGAKIYYTLDSRNPDLKSKVYSQPMTIDKTTTLKAFALAPGLEPSFIINAEFKKIPAGRKITLNTRYAGQYSAGGDLALIDFIRGGENFRTGTWQGYEGVDLDAVVDLGLVQPVKKISLGCFQDQGSWIFMPLETEFSISVDGKHFTSLPPVMNTVDEHADGPVIKDFTVEVNRKPVRFIRVKAVNRRICPGWHPGSGNKAWLFVDEIVIK